MRRMKRSIRFIGALLLMIMAVMTFKIDSKAESYDLPRVVVSGFEVSNGAVMPGTPFDLTLYLFNPSYSSGITSVLLTLENENDEVALIYGSSNQVYVEEIRPRNTVPVTVQCIVSEEVTQQRIPLDMDIEYYSLYSFTVTNETATVQIPIGSQTPFTVLGYDIPKTATYGSMSRLSLQYKNMSQKEINNAVLHISGNSIETQEISLGTLLPGTEDVAEAYIYYMSEGAQMINMEVTYTDGEGKEQTTGQITGTVEVSIPDEEASNATAGMSGRYDVVSCIQILVLVIIVVVLCMILVLEIKKHKSQWR